MLKTVRVIITANDALGLMQRYGIETSLSSYHVLKDFFDEYLQKLLFDQTGTEESLTHRLMEMGIDYSAAQELYIVLHDYFGCSILRLLSQYNDGSMSITGFVIYDMDRIEIQLKEKPVTNEDLRKASLIDLLRMDILEGIERGDYFNERYREFLDKSAGYLSHTDS